MKKSEVIVRELAFRGRKIIRAEDLKDTCKKYSFEFGKTKKLLLNTGYMLTIMRGVYYLKDYNEIKTGVPKYSAYELISKGLEVKGIQKWYFGLETALKLLTVTHEFFTINYIINDRFSRSVETTLLGNKFHFIKMKPSLFFGIKKIRTGNRVTIYYSDLEKTILDRIHLYKRKGSKDSVLLGFIKEYSDDLNKNVLLKYSRAYPTSVCRIVKGALNGS